MSKHTPGPWCLAKEYLAAEGVVFLVVGPSEDPDLKIEPLAQLTFCEEADARLMVASPELLEALKALSFEIEADPTLVRFFDLRLVEKMKAAIAKAEKVEDE